MAKQAELSSVLSDRITETYHTPDYLVVGILRFLSSERIKESDKLCFYC